MEDYLHRSFLRCKKLVCIRNPFRTVLERRQGRKMSEGLLQFPKHNTRGFRWPWSKSWCLGHLPAPSLAAHSLQRKKPMKGHQCKREPEWGWERAVHTTGINNPVCSDTKFDQQGLPLIPHRGQPLSLQPFHAMLLSDCKHFKDFHFQKYYINNSGTWNVHWNLMTKNWKILPFQRLSVLHPHTKYIKQRTFEVKSARFLSWLFFI